MRATFVPLLLAISAVPAGYAASVSGIVRDPSKSVIPGAVVTAQRDDASPPLTVKTDAQGRFTFDNLEPGFYAFTSTASGFDPEKVSAPVTDQPLNLVFDMKISEQVSSVEVAGKRSPLANSDKNYLALRNGAPAGSYKVENVVLKRDVATFTFRSGRFSILPPIDGHVLMVLFTGEGTFSLKPLILPEKRYLERLTGQPDVEEEFRSAVLCFTDGTYEELKSHWQSVDEPSAAGGAWAEFHDRMRRRTDSPRSMLEAMLSSEAVPNVEAELIADLYNSVGGSFTAFIHGRKHSDLRFIMRATGAMPFLPSPEEVGLINFDPGGEQEGIWYLSHLEGEWKRGVASSDEDRRLFKPEHYRIEAALGHRGRLTASCEVKVKATRSGMRVIAFGLVPDLRVARVRYQDADISFVQEDRRHDGSLYVILPAGAANDQTIQLLIEYDGSHVITDYGGGNFAVGARSSWYPSLNEFQDRATYDLTFRVPKQFTLVSVGALEKEWREADYSASHWVSEAPLAVAGFNYGVYKRKKQVDEQTKYTVEAYATEELPGYLRGFSQIGAMSPAALANNTIVDAENAIRCFTAWFGPTPYNRIAITQQPQFNFGQSWPNLVYLPVSALLDSTQRWMLLGGNAFRFADFIQEVTPHEVAHQWWGHMVGWSSYHDQWLSEGFADFSAGLFLQLTQPKSDEYRKFWGRARQAIIEKNSFGIRATDAGPIWMGLRLNTYKTGRAYNRIVYPKGGYVLHMLRWLMHDSQTGDHEFIDMMHDFTSTYANRTASTEDFQKIAEKHIKPAWDLTRDGRLNWFFGEWVYGTEVPRYALEYSLSPADGGKVLLSGKLTQSDVSERFAMAVPIYLDFGGEPMRAAVFPIAGNATREIKLTLPKKPKRVLLNYNNDVLASESAVKALKSE